MTNSATTHDARKPNDSPREDLRQLTLFQVQNTIVKEKWESVQGCMTFYVDPLLRYLREDAYRPKLLTIGPLQHLDQMVMRMEMEKRLYLESFLRRAMDCTGVSLDDFYQLVKDSSPDIGRCYEALNYRYYDSSKGIFRQDMRPTTDNDQYFLEMVLIDACFIVELLLQSFSKKNELAVNSSIKRDLFLVQNQLPLSILQDIYKRTIDENKGFPPFLRLACHFFSPYNNQNTPVEDKWANNVHAQYKANLERAEHFTDLLRTLQLPDPSHQNCSSKKSLWSNFSSCKKQRKDPESGMLVGEYLNGAALLQEAGVRFRASSSKCLLEIEFNKSNGSLKIPPLILNEWTEEFLPEPNGLGTKILSGAN